MEMLKATKFEILRGVKASGVTGIALEKEPIRVGTLVNEEKFNDGHFLIHWETIFFEDKLHDWSWKNGIFRYYTRVAEVADVVVVYETEEVAQQKRFDPMTGVRLKDAD
jgi:hypothetical protein